MDTRQHNFGPGGLTRFSHVQAWIFDLDNTLYPRDADLFSQINVKISTYVARVLNIPVDEATLKQKHFYKTYGTTLRGLMVEHDIVVDDYLDYVHDIDHSWVKFDPVLKQAIEALPGKKYIYTNGSVPHALAVTDQLGITDQFSDVFDIVRADLIPKPDRIPYEKFLHETGIKPGEAAFFEDLARNLTVPFDMGMRTVLIVPSSKSVMQPQDSWETSGQDEEFVEYVTPSLPQFLQAILDTNQWNSADSSN